MNATAITRMDLGHAAPLRDVTYLLVALVAFALFVRGRFHVAADAIATNVAHAPLFQFGFSGDVIGVAFFAVVAALVYGLFGSSHRGASLLAALCAFIGCAIQLFACLFHVVPRYVSIIQIEPLQSMALAFLKLNARAFNVGLIFFGIYGLLTGYLIFRSALMPRFAAVLLTFGGIAYLTNSFAAIVAAPLSPYVLLLPALGEGALVLCLLAALRRPEQRAGS